jgi:hypothetical protein
MVGLRMRLILCQSELVMASAEIVGILQERHPDHIVLSNGTLIFLQQGVSANHVANGRSLTASCRVRDGRHLTDGVRLNPDWLLDSVESFSLGS